MTAARAAQRCGRDVAADELPRPLEGAAAVEDAAVVYDEAVALRQPLLPAEARGAEQLQEPPQGGASHYGRRRPGPGQVLVELLHGLGGQLSERGPFVPDLPRYESRRWALSTPASSIHPVATCATDSTPFFPVVFI